jgi:D-glycero-alpha-D-manno-heptose-7-phosphate kinase
MTRITARVPVRADLAGGTLDLWPLYLFNPGSRTVNVAISIFAECEVETLSDSSIEICMHDAGVEAHFASLAELQSDERMTLFAKALEHFQLSGLKITTRTEAPRGSGLGGSSALAIALVRALSILAGRPVDGDALIHLVRDLETRLLGIPAGIQDYYPPVYGGLAALHLEPGDPVRHPVTVPLQEFARHLVMHYSGVSHFSGTNNWQMYKGFIDGDPRVREGLGAIARISVEMERALVARDYEAAGAALAAEWRARKKLVDGITTPEVDAVIAAATGAGAWAGKVCGAGGGGCIIILTPEDKRDAVIAALAKAPGKTLDVTPVGNGLTVEEERDTGVFRLSSRRTVPSGAEIEQLWLAADGGAYRPHVLAEAAMTFDAPRHGLHRTITRTFVAPIEPQSGMPRWRESDAIDLAQLDLRTAPEPGREMLGPKDPADLIARAAEGEQLLKELLVDSEKLTFFYNPPLAMFSQPHETRDEFLRRCLEHAEQGVEDQSERLEKTFRRRIDQMRERAEREQREVDDNTEDTEDAKHQQVGIAWGQTLYNITSGRPATSDAPRSRNEADYLEKITQLQKAWEREQEVLRDELNTRARSVEEVILSPELKGIETRRYVVLWIPEPKNP